jgi:hypothetical protein
MFVQFLHGPVKDPAAFRRLGEEWDRQLKPGAAGFLGSTIGVSADGEGVVMARFDSPESAKANSDRPEQSAWWASVQPNFTGPVTFYDTTDVELLMGGGSDAAGFVQIMRGKKADRALINSLDPLFEQHAPQWRPDILGGLRAWTAPDEYIEVMYFTSADAAHANEAKPPPPELMAHMGDVEAMMQNVKFIDITDPYFSS